MEKTAAATKPTIRNDGERKKARRVLASIGWSRAAAAAAARSRVSGRRYQP